MSSDNLLVSGGIVGTNAIPAYGGLSGDGTAVDYNRSVTVPTITTTPVPSLPGNTVFVNRPEDVAGFTPIYDDLAKSLDKNITPEPTLAEELADMKEQLNASFEEIANMLLALGDRFEDIDGRIARYNSRSSHKI